MYFNKETGAALRIIHIVARDLNNIIGVGDKIPWKSPDDLRFFKATTEGQICIVGRRTFMGLPKPLKSRMLFPVCRQNSRWFTSLNWHLHNEYDAPWGLHGDLDQTLQALTFQAGGPVKTVFIIGGRELYQQTLPFVDEAIISNINTKTEHAANAVYMDWAYGDHVNVRERTFDVT